MDFGSANKIQNTLFSHFIHNKYFFNNIFILSQNKMWVYFLYLFVENYLYVCIISMSAFNDFQVDKIIIFFQVRNQPYQSWYKILTYVLLIFLASLVSMMEVFAFICISQNHVEPIKEICRFIALSLSLQHKTRKNDGKQNTEINNLYFCQLFTWFLDFKNIFF